MKIDTILNWCVKISYKHDDRGVEMELNEFLKAVDSTTSSMTKDQLKELIHRFAYSILEEKRGEFLKIFESVGNDRTDDIMDTFDEVQDNYCIIKKGLEQICNGEKCLGREYHESEWWELDEGTVSYTDRDGVITIIASAITFIHECVENKSFDKGYDIAKILSQMEISDGEDYDSLYYPHLCLKDLFDNNLLSVSFEQMVTDAVFLSYMNNDLDKRAEAVYTMMHSLQKFNCALEDIKDLGNNELPEFKQFLPKWMEYLCRKDELSDENLTVVQDMLDDDELVLNYAQKYAKAHPGIYEHIMEKGLKSKSARDMVSIGLNALEMISPKYKQRGMVALKTAEYAVKDNQTDVAEMCWLDAFKSDSCFINFSRIMMLCDNDEYKKEAKKIYSKVAGKKLQNHNKAYYIKINEKDEKYVSIKEYFMILFFEKEFEKVWKDGMNEESVIGWPFTFLKEGLALFLMLLHGNDNYLAGMDAILEMVLESYNFQSDKYYWRNKLEDDCYKTNFYEILCRWKKNISIDHDVINAWLKTIGNIIERRIDKVIKEKRTTYYKECAALVVAYGEVLGSIGVDNAKANIIEKYKNEYPSKWAFHSELDELWGMK